MKKIYCLLTRRFVDTDIEYLQNHLDERIELVIPDNFEEKVLEDYLKNNKIEIMLGSIPNENLLRQTSELRLIQIPWNGIDNITLPDFIGDRVTICNSHGNAKSVAELAVSLMLALLKWIPLHDASLRNNDWRRPGGKSTFYAPETVSGKKIGILGFGRIGFEISKILSGFDVMITAVNRTGVNKFNSDVVVNDVSMMNELLAVSDIIFITLPLTSKTTGFIGSKEFSLMKSSSYIVNVSRGDIINEKDLYEALVKKQIAGAALDVWYKYPSRGGSEASPSYYPFHKLENVVLSPHRGGFVKDALPHLDDVVENLNRYAKGNDLINIVNLAESY